MIMDVSNDLPNDSGCKFSCETKSCQKIATSQNVTENTLVSVSFIKTSYNVA